MSQNVLITQCPVNCAVLRLQQHDTDMLHEHYLCPIHRLELVRTMCGACFMLDNADVMREDLKQQPSLIERLYGMFCL